MLIYLVRLADVMNIDIPAAVDRKIAKNAQKYPIARAKGSGTKYTDF